MLTGDAKATFNQASLDIGIRMIEIFNKVLAEITKHAFPAYAFWKQKRYLHRQLVKPRSMKISSFISRLQKLNAYFEDFLTGTECQETAPLSTDGIMDIIYHSMPTTWKNKMIKQGFNYADSIIKEMTDFFETRVENLEHKEDKKKIFSSCQENPHESQEEEKGRLRLQCFRVQQRINQSSPFKQKILHSTRKMQSFYRLLQRFTRYGQQAQTEEKEEFR